MILTQNQREAEDYKEIVFFQTFEQESIISNFIEPSKNKTTFFNNSHAIKNTLKEHNDINLLSKRIDALENKILEKNTMFFFLKKKFFNIIKN